MTEVLVSMSVLLLVSVGNLRVMTCYLVAEKSNYERTVSLLQHLSMVEWQL